MPDKKVTAKDFTTIAEYIVSEWERRKSSKDRSEKAKQWDEIDRQLRMDPDLSHKLDANGKKDPNLAWLPELELPLQSQTSEVLTADAARMMFPDSGPWFSAHVAMTDEYFERVDFKSLITGDEMEVPSKINQENADRLVEGLLNHYHRQYDFAGVWDRINTESFSYGVGVGRVRMATKSVIRGDAKGVVKDNKKIPILFPRSIKKTYLDDRPFNLMNEGQVTGPAIIFEESKSLKDMKAAAKKGKSGTGEDAGWMYKNFAGLEADNDDTVTVLEYEGDLVVPRKTTEAIHLNNVIVTVVKGGTKEKVVRLRYRDYSGSSYLLAPYHYENLESPYPTSPLMKGRPIQKAASHAFVSLLASGELSNFPPVSYDRHDPTMANEGGPRIHPRAQWGTSTGEVKPHKIGDPSTSLATYQHLLQQYYDVTGVNAPRLGAQTKSHTTAYSKEAEISRGTVRTVDYVKSTLNGPMAQFLSMEFDMVKGSLKGKETVYLDSYKGFVDLEKEHIPELATFEVYGAGGPGEANAKSQAKMESLQLSMQVDQMKLQTGTGQPMNYNAIQEQIMREGGWVDTDPFFNDNDQGLTGEPMNPALLTEMGLE